MTFQRPKSKHKPSAHPRRPNVQGGAYNRGKTDGKRAPAASGRIGKAHTAPDASVVSARFSNLLISAARQAFPTNRGLVAASGANAEPLAFLEYQRELELKNQALRQFWKNQGLPDKPNLVLPSPRPRH